MSQQNTATETSSAAELAELRESVRDFLAAKSGQQRVRVAIETERGYDEDLWQQMAEQLSLPGLALPAVVRRPLRRPARAGAERAAERNDDPILTARRLREQAPGHQVRAIVE